MSFRIAGKYPIPESRNILTSHISHKGWNILIQWSWWHDATVGMVILVFSNFKWLILCRMIPKSSAEAPVHAPDDTVCQPFDPMKNTPWRMTRYVNQKVCESHGGSSCSDILWWLNQFFYHTPKDFLEQWRWSKMTTKPMRITGTWADKLIFGLTLANRMLIFGFQQDITWIVMAIKNYLYLMIDLISHAGKQLEIKNKSIPKPTHRKTIKPKIRR